jgi:hypothetical protein
MAGFRNPNVSVAKCSQGASEAIRKSVGHIPNFVVAAAPVRLMFYLLENRGVACLVEVP